MIFPFSKKIENRQTIFRVTLQTYRLIKRIIEIHFNKAKPGFFFFTTNRATVHLLWQVRRATASALSRIGGAISHVRKCVPFAKRTRSAMPLADFLCRDVSDLRDPIRG